MPFGSDSYFGPLFRDRKGLHQLVARQTYPELLAALGAAPAHAEAIRAQGPAYRASVRDYSRLLLAVGLMD